jgi:hypothetical protein
MNQAEAGTLFAKNSKVVMYNKAPFREQMQEHWRAIDGHDARRSFINSYLKEMGDVTDLTYVIGDKFLRSVLNENIERIRNRQAI